jgi:BTB/POZ domain-containing protein KCTD9
VNVTFKIDVKKTIFDGSSMDKLAYALLKGHKANLDNVSII